MFNLTPALRITCSSVNIRCVVRLLERNYIYTPWKYENLHQTKAFNFYKLQKYSTAKSNRELKVSNDSDNATGEITTYEAIKENTKTAWYGGIVILGLGVAGTIFYVLFRELFSSNSPNSVYSQAFQRCIQDEKVVFNLGEPVKGHGEENRRRRRQHVSHLIYEKDGINYMRMKFHLQGSRKNATVHLEMKENENGKYEYRYLFVQLDEYPYNTIILEDNRNKTNLTTLPPISENSVLS